MTLPQQKRVTLDHSQASVVPNPVVYVC